MILITRVGVSGAVAVIPIACLPAKMVLVVITTTSTEVGVVNAVIFAGDIERTSRAGVDLNGHIELGLKVPLEAAEFRVDKIW